MEIEEIRLRAKDLGYDFDEWLDTVCELGVTRECAIDCFNKMMEEYKKSFIGEPIESFLNNLECDD